MNFDIAMVYILLANAERSGATIATVVDETRCFSGLGVVPLEFKL